MLTVWKVIRWWQGLAFFFGLLWFRRVRILVPTEAFSVITSTSTHIAPHQQGFRRIFALSSSLLPQQQSGRSILRTLTLVDAATDELMAQGYELELLPEERNKPDEDELEMLYPTQRQFFQFGLTMNENEDEAADAKPSRHPPPVQQVRTTSFGCSRMGHQVWPSSMALCLSLIHEYYCSPDGVTSLPQSVLELGAGCGLPSIVCRDVLQIPSVVATDFWYFGGKYDDSERETGRLIPEVWHGINLAYNIERNEEPEGVQAIVRRADWHDLETVRQAASAAGTGGVDLVIGSDLIYYGMDVNPLWNTIETLLQDCGASKVVLISPVKETRESLPVFLEVLESKTDSRNNSRFQLERGELHLYKSDEDLKARQDADRFLKLTVTKSPHAAE